MRKRVEQCELQHRSTFYTFQQCPAMSFHFTIYHCQVWKLSAWKKLNYCTSSSCHCKKELTSRRTARAVMLRRLFIDLSSMDCHVTNFFLIRALQGRHCAFVLIHSTAALNKLNIILHAESKNSVAFPPSSSLRLADNFIFYSFFLQIVFK